MAEATPGPEQTGATAGDVDLELVLKTGEVTYKGKRHTLTVRQSGLELESADSKKTATPVLNLVWSDVVCACTGISRSGKATSKATSGSSGSLSRDAGGDTRSLIIHFVQKAKKNNKLRCENVKVEILDGGSREWIDMIEDKRKEGKPRKLLVIINPIGGKGQGRQTFEKTVRPLFELAGIESIVKVTDHYKHAIEIASTFDLSTVDGVIASGGDGFYVEVLHGILQQTQEKAAVDSNDPDASLVPPPVPIGLMPTGTGNGVSGWVNGDVLDVVTATLNIVRGVTTKVNIMSIHDNGKLVHYCGLRLGYGYLAHIMKRTDEKRWMKRARYPYVILSSLFWENYVFDIDVDILQIPSSDSEKEEGEGEATITQPPRWVSLGRKTVTSLMGWVANFKLTDMDHMVFDPFNSYADLILHTSTSNWHLFSFLAKMVTRKKNLSDEPSVERWCVSAFGLSETGRQFDEPSIERYRRVVGFRFRYVGDRPSARPGSSAGPESGHGGGGEPAAAAAAAATGGMSERDQLSRCLDVDGELQDSELSSVDCRLLPQFVPVFGVPFVPT